jgi:hypothetical protein
MAAIAMPITREISVPRSFASSCVSQAKFGFCAKCFSLALSRPHQSTVPRPLAPAGR